MNDCIEFQINKHMNIKIYEDNTLSINLREDTIDLNTTEVKKLERIIAKYHVLKDIRKGGTTKND